MVKSRLWRLLTLKATCGLLLLPCAAHGCANVAGAWMRRSDHPGSLLTEAIPGFGPAGALKCAQFCSRQNCGSAKVTKTTPPGARYLSFLPGVRRIAAHPFGGMEVLRTSTNTPPYPRPTGRSTNSPGAELRASGSNTVSLKYSRWGCDTRRALRGLKNRGSTDRHAHG